MNTTQLQIVGTERQFIDLETTRKTRGILAISCLQLRYCSIEAPRSFDLGDRGSAPLPSPLIRTHPKR